MSSFFSVSRKDLANSLVMAAIAAVGGSLYQVAIAGTLDIFTYDWGSVGKLVVNAVVIYLVKKFLTTKSGQFLGVVGYRINDKFCKK